MTPSRLHKLGSRGLLFGSVLAILLAALAVPLKRHRTAAQGERYEGLTQMNAQVASPSGSAMDSSGMVHFASALSIENLKSEAAASPVRVPDLKVQLLEKRRRAAALNAGLQSGPLVAPPNDLCAGAEVISGSGPFPLFTAVTADITDATTTNDPPLPSCQPSVSRSIWYRFTPTTTASYDVSSCSSDGTASTVDDTVIAIYTSSSGTCGGTFTEVPVACDDDGCAAEDLQSVISNVRLNGGTTYFILVWQFDVTPPLPGNTSVQLRINQTPSPANDTCAGATTLALNAPLAGTTFAAFNDYQLTGASCFTGIGQTSSSTVGREVVYSFTATSANTYSFKVTNYSAAANLVMYASNSCPAATPGTPVNIACNNISGPAFAASNRAAGSTSEELMCVPLTNGQQIFIFVDDNNDETTFAGTPFVIEASTCVRETEANNTPATANSFGSQAFGIEGSITPAGDVDFYSLGSPGAGSRVFALVDGEASNSTDFDMRVTTTVDTLEYDDLNADVLFSTLSPAIGGTPVSSAGPVFLRVNNFLAAAAAEPYRLYYTVQPPGANPLPSCGSVTTSAMAESEPNNTPAQADQAVNNYFSGSLAGPAPSTDLDVFSFTASAGQVVFISLDGDPCRDNTPINGKLELIGTDGSTVLITVNDGGSTSNTTSGAGSLTATTPNSPAEGLAFRVTTGGTYFARVSIGTTSSGATGAGDYLLSISRGIPTAAAGIITGRITTSGGTPVPGTVVNLAGSQTRKTITDESGNYRFEGVEINGFYTVTPARANFSFTPANRLFSQLSEETEAAFTASLLGEAANPLDTTEYFVRQQYVDVLGREPDEGGFNYWSNQILACGPNTACVNSRRQEVAAAFFIEAEFQRTGSYLYGLYKGGLGRRPLYQEFSSDRGQIVDGPNLEVSKQRLAEAFVGRPEFLARYQANLTAESFVDALLRSVQQASGIDLGAERAELISSYNSGSSLADSRSRALRAITEGAAFSRAEYNSAFVLTEYFAYLRRDPDDAGYEFWLDVLNNHAPGNYRSMVCAFITSAEYQRRFSMIVSRSNRDCGR